MDHSSERISNFESHSRFFNTVVESNTINVNATNAIRAFIDQGKTLTFNFLSSTPEFDCFADRMDCIFNSEEVGGYRIRKCKGLSYTPYRHWSFAVSMLCDQSEYVFHLFNNIILVFLTTYEGKSEFLVALDSSAVKVTAKKKLCEKTVVVYEKSRLPIREYDGYCPVSDAKILSSRWTKTNLDGSRSFAGGLKPENNPLIFTLEYGVLNIAFCGITFEVSFSNGDAVKDGEAMFVGFEAKDTVASSLDEKNNLKNTALAIVKKMTPKADTTNSKYLKGCGILLLVLIGIIVFAVAISWLVAWWGMVSLRSQIEMYRDLKLAGLFPPPII